MRQNNAGNHFTNLTFSYPKLLSHYPHLYEEASFDMSSNEENERENNDENDEITYDIIFQLDENDEFKKIN